MSTVALVPLTTDAFDPVPLVNAASEAFFNATFTVLDRLVASLAVNVTVILLPDFAYALFVPLFDTRLISIIEGTVLSIVTFVDAVIDTVVLLPAISVAVM